MSQLTVSEEISSLLLDIDAVTLSPRKPFTWASGLKSPIYCDNRRILGYPDIRRKVASSIVSSVSETAPETDWIVGTATAGIPHAAWVSEQMNLPMGYVRSKKKGHGQQNQIEGAVPSGARAAVVEDLISTGGSVMTAVHALRDQGIDVLGVYAIFSYGFDVANKLFESEGIRAYPLTDFQTLVGMARNTGRISEDEWEILSEWRKDPKAWSDQILEAAP